MIDFFLHRIVRKYQICHLSLSYCFPSIYSCRVLSLDLVDDNFDQILILFGVRRMPLCKGVIFEFENVDLENIFIHSVWNSGAIPAYAPSVTSSILLLHLGFVPHDDVLDIFLLLTNMVLALSFHLKTSISKSSSD